MVKIIPSIRKETFSDKLVKGINSAAQDFPEQYGKYKKYEDDEDKKKAARTKGLPKSMDSYLKKFHESYLSDEKRYNAVSDLAHRYAQEGYRHEDAIRLALDDVSRESKATKHQGVLKALSPSGRGPEEKGFVGGIVGKAAKAIGERPSLLATEAPVAVAKSEQAQRSFHDPMGSLLSNVFKAVAPDKFSPKDSEGRPMIPNTPENMLKGYFRKHLNPEETEGAETVSDIQSALIDLILPGLKGPKSKAAAPVQEAQDAIRSVQKQTLAKDLGGRASSGSVEGATAARLERVAPESRLYKPGEQAAIREQQLKMEPQYAEEIAKDASERAARQAEKAPKTVVGEAGVARRQEAARSLLPKAQDSYAKAIARVRALEDELARGVPQPQAARMDALVKAAKQELAESEFFLKSTLNNAKTGEARVGIDQMRDAARSKVLKIAEDVSEGKEIKLPLKDYNPEIVKQAKALAKKKSLPATKGEDFFTQVHDAYANEYRPRLAQVEKELSDLKGQATLGNLQRATQLRREKEAIQKLIDHIDAENAIHRHKIALRETGQRKLARERLGQFTKQAGEENVKRLAKEALKSPEAAAEAVDAAVSEAAAQAPNDAMRQKILGEKEAVSNQAQKMASREGKIGEVFNEISKGSSTAKEASSQSFRIMRDIKEVFDSLRGSGKNLFKTRIGKDFLIGVSSELFTQITKGEDFPLTASTLASIAGGRSSGAYRYGFAQLTRWLWKKGQKAEYKRALSEGDDEKLIRLRDKMSPKLRKESAEEYRQSISA